MAKDTGGDQNTPALFSCKVPFAPVVLHAGVKWLCRTDALCSAVFGFSRHRLMVFPSGCTSLHPTLVVDESTHRPHPHLDLILPMKAEQA